MNRPACPVCSRPAAPASVLCAEDREAFLDSPELAATLRGPWREGDGPAALEAFVARRRADLGCAPAEEPAP